MHKNCSEDTITFFDLIVHPNKTVTVKDKMGNEFSILVINIFYIECKESDKNHKDKRDVKIIHLCSPIDYNGKLLSLIEWKTKLTLKEIVEKFSKYGFIQINKRIAVKTVNIQGRDSKWEYLQLITISYQTNQITWQSKELQIGRNYKKLIEKALKLLALIEVKNSNGIDVSDVLYINPTEIIYIKLSKFEITIHLNKPFYNNGNNCYKIIWKTRKNTLELINYFSNYYIFQSNRNTLINLSYIVGELPEYQETILLSTHNQDPITLRLTRKYYNIILNR